MKYKVYKKRDFVDLLLLNGFKPCRTAKHEVFTRDGCDRPITIPKTKEINPIIAQKIIKNYKIDIDNIKCVC